MGRKKKKESKFIMHVNPNYKKPEPVMSDIDKQVLDLSAKLEQYSKDELISLYIDIVKRDATLAKLIMLQNKFFKLNKKTDKSLLMLAEQLVQMPEFSDSDEVLACLDLLIALEELPEEE